VTGEWLDGTNVTAPPSLVRIESLCKSYRGASNPALLDVSLEIAAGSCFGLLGPNGAGKTTLISVLSGVIRADSGRVRLCGSADQWIDCRPGSTEAAKFIGLVPQDFAFYPTLTIRENLACFGAMHGLRGSALRRGLAAGIAVGRLEAFCDQRADTLSGGLQRRLNLAIGLVHAPRLLVLDEPTVGVDAQSRLFVLEELVRLKAAGTTILYTSHYLDEVQQICDALAIIDRGRVITQGALADLLKHDLVTLRLAHPPPPELLKALTAIPSVHGLRQAGASLALISSDPPATMSAALALARDSGSVIAEAAIGRRTLDELFFQLTGTQLRDHGDDAAAA
jgi:ABC-2 type transport system ATP-binding protein